VPEASARFDNTGGRASHFRKDHVTCTEFATVELYQHASERYKESLEIKRKQTGKINRIMKPKKKISRKKKKKRLGREDKGEEEKLML